ncbi:hypothetical protein BD413DRAFT_215211 [Trametes elegans]|nr:hypothetical protein BD413DRAFT_215211 [Trametes elegans]
MGSIIVINKHSEPIQVFVSKYSDENGSDAWCTLAPLQRDVWNRSGWELVAFKVNDDNQRAGIYVQTNTAIIFHNLHTISVV